MYYMAAYCRLSKEDGENKISESIENQIKLIREYVNKAEDMEIGDIYIDDGYSGLYFANRPEFQRMMEDIYKGKIQGVITKDISRLGREHIETSNYIERVFPSLGIRYVAILDGVDSDSHSNEELAQFKTLFNDMYSRDISKKIRGALSAQKKKGQFMSAFAPYGYMKDPKDKHHFLIDQESAKIVRKIFYMYLEGYSKGGIAKKLNEEGVLTPSEYKREIQGLNYFNAQEKAGTKGWSYSTIHTILRNRVYTGAMVQHKSEKISYKIQKYHYIPEAQQYIVEGMHDPLISEDTFDLAQRIMEKRSRSPGFYGGAKKVNPYAGVLVCGDCGYNFQKVTGRQGYECGSYHKKGNTVCCSHFLKKKILDTIVKSEVERQVKFGLDENERQELRKAADCKQRWKSQQEETIRRMNQWEKELQGIQNYQKKTYENYMDGILDKKEYFNYKAEYEKQAQLIRKKLEEAEEKQAELLEKKETSQSWIERLATYGTLSEITRELVTELIDKIIVYRNNDIEIRFKYHFPYLL